ncbi:MAG: hypothetical protein M1832_006222 [Thelocarpon impressellum]|nr:MAG: hypothetical protein M1832_006222 [Thelocarpon impressellum]
MAPPSIPAADLASFTTVLQSSTRILALLGAGVSAASGLPTFRGAGGLWRNHDATMLATPEAFEADPVLVWQFYSYRRDMALKAQPNRAHLALAELARKKEGFVTLTQNVDDLSRRAGHPPSQLHLLHGSLFALKCTSFYCTHSESENYSDPLVPALAASFPGPPTVEELPHCPTCTTGLLRPGVVWFGEPLPEQTLTAVDDWIASAPKIDLMLVIGTGARVYPAAAYVDAAKAKGARVAVVNMDRADEPKCSGGLQTGKGGRDWFFEGDAGVIVPEILKSVIGKV